MPCQCEDLGLTRHYLTASHRLRPEAAPGESAFDPSRHRCSEGPLNSRSETVTRIATSGRIPICSWARCRVGPEALRRAGPPGMTLVSSLVGLRPKRLSHPALQQAMAPISEAPPVEKIPAARTMAWSIPTSP